MSESVRPVSVCRAGRDDVEQSYKPVPAQPPEAGETSQNKGVGLRIEMPSPIMCFGLG